MEIERFRQKTVEVEVAQLTSVEDIPAMAMWVRSHHRSAEVFGTKHPVLYIEVEGDGPSPKREQVNIGDVVLLEPSGDFRIIPFPLFLSIYEPVEPAVAGR